MNTCEACGTKVPVTETTPIVVCCLNCSLKQLVADAMLGRQVRLEMIPGFKITSKKGTKLKPKAC